MGGIQKLCVSAETWANVSGMFLHANIEEEETDEIISFCNTRRNISCFSRSLQFCNCRELHFKLKSI